MWHARSRPKQKPLFGSGVVSLLEQQRLPTAAAARRGPMAVMKAVEDTVVSTRQKQEWLAESRLDAILGACSRSHKSVRSGIKCWMAFVGIEYFMHELCAHVYVMFLYRQLRPSIEEIFPAAVGFALVMDNNVQIWENAAKLYWLRADRLSTGQGAYTGKARFVN